MRMSTATPQLNPQLQMSSVVLALSRVLFILLVSVGLALVVLVATLSAVSDADSAVRQLPLLIMP